MGTPSHRGDGHADLRHVYAVAKEIPPEVNDFKVAVIKSTVPVGTGNSVEDIVRQTKAAKLFSVVPNPEFLREGAAIEDLKRPDRVVVGCRTTVLARSFRNLIVRYRSTERQCL